MIIIQENMRKVNYYFFGEETISLHDFLWFYGSMGFIALIGLFVLTLNVVAGVTL